MRGVKDRCLRYAWGDCARCRGSVAGESSQAVKRKLCSAGGQQRSGVNEKAALLIQGGMRERRADVHGVRGQVCHRHTTGEMQFCTDAHTTHNSSMRPEHTHAHQTHTCAQPLALHVLRLYTTLTTRGSSFYAFSEVKTSVKEKRVGSPSWDLNPGVFCSRIVIQDRRVNHCATQASRNQCFSLIGRPPAGLYQPAMWGTAVSV